MLEKEKILNKQGHGKAREVAAMWFLRLRENEVSEEDFAKWRRWLAEDSANEREFDEIVELWNAYDQLDDLPWPSEKEIENEGVSIPGRCRDAVIALITPFRPAQLVLATSLLLLISMTVSWLSIPGLQSEKPLHFETGIAEHRTLELADGSVVVLGAKTNMSVDYTNSMRSITLYQGEAYFEVFKDKDRPFLVVAGRRSIRAVGTAFNVNIGAEKVSVTVVEGLIRIEPAGKVATDMHLRHTDVEIAGEQAITNVSGGHGVVYDAKGVLEKLPEKDTETATSWQGGRLVFIDKPLDSVIADINRYSSREIIISDHELDSLRYTGTVFQNEISGWLQGLDKAFPVRIIDLGDRKLVVIARKDV